LDAPADQEEDCSPHSDLPTANFQNSESYYAMMESKQQETL